MTGVTPNGIRYPDGASKARMLGPELQQMAEDIDQYLTEQLAGSNPAFIALARAAVAAAILAEDIITGDNERAMHYGRTNESWTLDDAGKAVSGSDALGRFHAPHLVSRRAEIAGIALVEGEPGVWRFLDAEGKVVLEINANTGKVLIADLDSRSSIGGGSIGAQGIDRVVVPFVIGQSNAAARGLPTNPRLDVQHPRIYMARWSGTEVVGLGPATVPNSSQQVLATAGLGPGDVIARRIAAESESTAVVICNAARGGSGLVIDTANGVWGVGYTGTNTHLLPIALNALSATLALVAAMFPGVPVDVQVIWHQGESDGAQTYAAYRSALIAVFNAVRSHIGDSTAPIVMGGTVPEDSTPAEEANIMAAQIALQADMQYTAFAKGVPNGGGASAPSGDTVHYHRAGVERLGARMYEALRRAYVNNTASIPTPTLDVSARWRKSVGILDIDWAFPLCRATSFTVQYSVDGGGWQTVSARTRPLDPIATVTGLTTGNEIRVRVATVNEVGISAYTTPITAIGA